MSTEVDLDTLLLEDGLGVVGEPAERLGHPVGVDEVPAFGEHGRGGLQGDGVAQREDPLHEGLAPFVGSQPAQALDRAHGVAHQVDVRTRVLRVDVPDHRVRVLQITKV